MARNVNSPSKHFSAAGWAAAGWEKFNKNIFVLFFKGDDVNWGIEDESCVVGCGVNDENLAR